MVLALSGRKTIVVGLGKTGQAAVRFLKKRGAHVVATDSAAADELAPAVAELDVEVIAGGHQGVAFADAALVVVSPGVPPLPELDAAAAAGVDVIGEIELGARYARAPILAVGGTNGKSTTTVALGRLLEAGGLCVFSGGNLGTPLVDAIDGDFDALVVEVSSFQLERAPTFRPKVSVLLNVSEDHLDRYPSFEAYAHAKGNAFANQQAGDVAVVPAGDRDCAAQAARGRGAIVTFGPGGDFETTADAVVARDGERYDLGGCGFHGAHNRLNAAAAIAAARAFGTEPAAVRRGLQAFEPLAHRMALVATVRGVRFYDDSKATNVGAAVTALLGLSEPRAVLIAGGRDKLGSYEPLAAALARRGRAAVLIGEAADKIARSIGDRLPVARASDMEEAVRRAAELARPGDAVLLSPACSSFDWFSSYAERGERFVAAVARFQAGVES